MVYAGINKHPYNSTVNFLFSLLTVYLHFILDKDGSFEVWSCNLCLVYILEFVGAMVLDVKAFVIPVTFGIHIVFELRFLFYSSKFNWPAG